MPRITEYGPTRPRLSTGALGYNPGIVTGELPEEPDLSEGSGWFIPIDSAAEPAVVQWKRSTQFAGVATCTLDDAPTPGNVLVAFVPLRESDGITVTMSGTGWTLVESAYTGPGASNWPCYVYERTVQPGDGSAWSATRSSGSGNIAMWLVEVEGVAAVDASDASSDATTEPTLSLTPVTSDPILILSFVSVRKDTATAFTAAGGMTELVDDFFSGTSTGPQIAINYEVDLAPTGSYTVGSTYGGGSRRAVIAASFVGPSEVLYLPAPAVVDGDDNTFEYVDVTQDEFLRGILGAAYVLATVVLRVGLETSGSKTITLEGANESDFSDAVTLDSVTYTAAGSYTAEDVTFDLPGTDGYLYLRFLLTTPEGIHPHEVDLFAPVAGGVTDHGALTGLADDDHPQYATNAEFDDHSARHEPGGADPLSGYLTTTAGGGDVISTIAASGAAETIDLANGNVHDVTLTDDCTFTFTSPASGRARSFTLFLRQGASPPHLATWPGSVEWAGGAAPTLSTALNDVDVLTFVTLDGGTVWFGFAAGGGAAIDYGEDGDISDLDFADVADAGVLDEVARADHVHGMPAEPAGGGHGPILLASDHSVPFTFDEILQASDGSDFLYASE
jgi:hypothetical protein